MFKYLGIVAALGGCGSDPAVCTTGCDDVDAAPDAPPSGSIDVVVLDDHGLPAIGLRVIATSAGGADTATTGNDGTATLSVTGAADVTVVRTTGLGTSLTTIRAAEPGDRLTFGHRHSETPSVPRTLTWPSDAKAFRYVARVSCGGTAATVVPQPTQTQSATIMLDPSCADDFDAMVSYITQFTTEQGFLLATGNAGDVTFTGTFANIDSEPANFAQLPTDVEIGNMRFVGTTVFRSVDPAFGQAALGVITGNANGANGVIALPTPGSAGRELALSLSHDTDIKRGQLIVDRVPPQGQYNLDVEPAMVPWMPSPPVVDLAGKSISWTELSAGPLARTGGDLIVAELDYNRGSSAFHWRIISPPGAQPTLAIPELPGDEVFEPHGTDTLGPSTVRIYGFGAGADYAVLRPRADLAISPDVSLFFPTDTFLTTGLTSMSLSRMTVSFYTP